MKNGINFGIECLYFMVLLPPSKNHIQKIFAKRVLYLVRALLARPLTKMSGALFSENRDANRTAYPYRRCNSIGVFAIKFLTPDL